MRLDYLLTGLWCLPDTIIGSFRHADWQTARRNGWRGILAEAVRSLLCTNTSPYFVPAKSQTAARLALRQIRIPTWGWGTIFGETFFRVPLRQDWLAMRALSLAGIKILHREIGWW